MAYRSNLNTFDKSGAIAGVIAVHVALAIVLLNLAGKIPFPEVQRALKVFSVTEVPPPPPPPPPPVQQQAPKPKQKEGAAAPKNVKSQATPVKRVPPRISLPLPVPVQTSPTPRTGTQATQGASTPGPGTGAGGTGTGTGSGAGGNGSGGGGDEGIVYPPHLLTSVLRGRDFSREALEQWPRGAQVFMRFRIDPRGYITECTVDHGTGVAAIDDTICNLAHDRLRFRPALNRLGQPVAAWFGYRQTPPG